MCTVSMIGDFYNDKWAPRPWYSTVASPARIEYVLGMSREEFDALKKEVEEIKELIKRVKKYDEDHGEPNCEIEDKMKLLRRVAKAVGVELEDVLKN